MDPSAILRAAAPNFENFLGVREYGMPLTEDALMRHIVQEFQLQPDDVNFDTELFDEGLLDSMAVTELLVYLETEGGFEIDPEEIIPENIGSVCKMLAFAGRKSNDG